jgi:hypothetical protein
MKTLYDALRESHERQRRLCTRLTRLRPANAAGRTETLQALKAELAAHAAAEERHLYAPMLMDDLGLDVSRHALSEHHEIDECVEKLESLDPAGEAWGLHAKALAHEVRHHLKEEETRFFQVSGRILGAAQKRALRQRYEQDYARLLGRPAG